MRTSICLFLAVPGLLSTGAAFPHPENLALNDGVSSLEDVAHAEELEFRAAPTDGDDKPKYSTVPLFPDEDDDEDSGGGDGGEDGNGGDEPGDGEDGDNGDDDGDGVVTLIRTVTDDPVTKILTKTVPDDEETKTVTKALPTTKTVVSVIDMDGEVTTTVFVTQTPEPLPPPPAPEPTTVVVTEEPESSTEISTPTPSSIPSDTPSNTPSSTPSASTWQPTVILPDPTSTLQPTTFVTLTKSSSSSTHDDGQWPVTKDYDNGQWHTTYPPWNATDSSRWRRVR